MIYPFSKYDILATDFTTKAMIHIHIIFLNIK
jgi:hypothetical protein